MRNDMDQIAGQIVRVTFITKFSAAQLMHSSETASLSLFVATRPYRSIPRRHVVGYSRRREGMSAYSTHIIRTTLRTRRSVAADAA